MSDELKNDAMQEAYEKLKSWGFAAGSYHCFCSECGKTHTADKRSWRCLECAERRADLLPVVKPLVWEDLPKPEKGKKQARTIFGHFYSIAGFSDGTWAWYTSFKAAKSGHSGLQACGLTEQEAKDAAQTDHTAQAARLLPQIDPAELVAGAYEAAAGKLAKAAQAEAEINNPHDAESQRIIHFLKAQEEANA